MYFFPFTPFNLSVSFLPENVSVLTHQFDSFKCIVIIVLLYFCVVFHTSYWPYFLFPFFPLLCFFLGNSNFLVLKCVHFFVYPGSTPYILRCIFVFLFIFPQLFCQDLFVSLEQGILNLLRVLLLTSYYVSPHWFYLTF